MNTNQTSEAREAEINKVLDAAYGGLVLVNKAEEIEQWKARCEAHGRAGDLVLVNQNSQFNFLQRELAFQQSQKNVSIYEIVSALIQQQQKNGASNTEEYFDAATRQVLSNAVQALLLAHNAIGLDQIRALINTAPKTLQQAADQTFRAGSFCAQTLALAEKNCPEAKKMDLALAQKFFLVEYPKLNAQSRASIEERLKLALDAMLVEPLRGMFCAGTTVSPDDVLAGRKIVLVALPIEEHGQVGEIAGKVWKFAVQKAAERDRETPIFICAGPEFASSYDPHFAITARAARCTVI